MVTVRYKLRSICPMILHNDQAVNPRNTYAIQMKELTSKRKKTEEDLLLLAAIEWEAGLYYDKNIGYHLPERVINGALLNSAKQFKLGTAFKQGVLVADDYVPLVFAHNKKKPEDLYKMNEYVDFRAVKIGTSKVMRSRPIIPAWETEINLMLTGEKFNERDLLQIVENAGKFVGIGDYRPRYGRFEVEAV